MQFKTDNIERTNTIEIQVLIVEDSFVQAENIKNSIESYHSIFNGKRDIFRNDINVLYKAIVNGKFNYTEQDFTSETAFADSLLYLKGKGKEVDIILCDFDLGNSKGDEFLLQVKNLEENFLRWYKVLHSVGWEYQKYQNANIADFTFDAKNKHAIQEVVLKTFEDTVLQTLLFGNSKQYMLNYHPSKKYEFKFLSNTSLYFKIPTERILYICRKPKYPKKFIMAYMNEDYSITEKVSEEALTGLKELDTFLSIGRSLVINKLWIGDVSILDNRVKFIRPVNQSYIFDIDKFLEKVVQKLNIFKYLHNLISNKKIKSSKEFQTNSTHFHFV